MKYLLLSLITTTYQPEGFDLRECVSQDVLQAYQLDNNLDKAKYIAQFAKISGWAVQMIDISTIRDTDSIKQKTTFEQIIGGYDFKSLHHHLSQNDNYLMCKLVSWNADFTYNLLATECLRNDLKQLHFWKRSQENPREKSIFDLQSEVTNQTNYSPRLEMICLQRAELMDLYESLQLEPNYSKQAKIQLAILGILFTYFKSL